MQYQKNQENPSKRKSGFTLIEVMIVIIIVGVLASLALPRFTGTLERVRATEGVQILTALLGAQKAYEIENGNYTAVLNDLDVTFPVIANFLTPIVYNPADPVANPIADIERSGVVVGDGYILDINEVGAIDCTDGAVFLCVSAGY